VGKRERMGGVERGEGEEGGGGKGERWKREGGKRAVRGGKKSEGGEESGKGRGERGGEKAKRN